jgi:hypothetical protein
VRRKVSTKKYLLAFFLTVAIFVIGILIGMWFENLRLAESEQVILDEKVSLRSLQLQQKYIDLGLADCGALNQLLQTNIDELGKKVAEVISYERRAFFTQTDFNLQLRDYFLTELQYLFLAQEIEQTCDQNSVKIVYFYDENEFDTQGDILSYVKKLFGSRVLVFSFNANFNQEPMIPILINSYDIVQYPSVVIEEKVLQGHTSVEEVIDLVCDEFLSMAADAPKECKDIAASRVTPFVG